MTKDLHTFSELHRGVRGRICAHFPSSIETLVTKDLRTFSELNRCNSDKGFAHIFRAQ